MGEHFLYFIVSLVATAILGVVGVLIWRIVFLHFQKKHRVEQSKQIRFLQVQIPKNAVARSSDIDAKDHIQSMKQNIELMNQVYKNFYAIFDEGWENKWFGNNAISMEMIVEKEVIKFFLGVPKEHLMTVEKMISSFYIGAIVEQVKQPKLLEAGKFFAGGEFSLTKDSVHPIKTYEAFEADPMDSILSAFSNINRDEKVWIQILVEPLHEDWLKKMRKKADDIKDGKKALGFRGIIKKIRNSGSKEDKENKKEQEKKKHNFSQQQLGDFDKKMDDELFQVKMRTIATSPDQARPKKIIDDISRLFNQYNYIWLNTIKFSKAQDLRKFAKHYVMRLFYSDNPLLEDIKKFNKTTILNIKELSSIIHFPHGRFNQNPRIAWQKFKVVPAPDDLPTEGIVVGYNTYGGVKREIRITDKDRFRHIYILGQTGTGKSTIMYAQAVDDMKNGRGFTFIDPHGEACEYLLKRFPKERIDDLIYFDLGNTAYPIGLNPLEVNPEDSDEKDVVTNDLVEMFIQMYGPEIFGPRIQDYFRNGCLLLMDQPEGGTIVDIMRLFTDEAFAEAKIRNLKDPVVASRWNKTYKKMGDREKAEIIPFIQAKFGPFTTGVYVRNIIGQPKSAFNMYDAMQQKKIILMNLSKGIAGEETSKLIGKIIAMQVKLSALKRAKISEKDRVPHYLYVDEFQNYVSQSFESILSEARKYKVGLVVAHQYTDQLKQEGLGGNMDLSKTIFGNIGNMFVFKVGAPDAEFLTKEFEPEFNQTDLTSTEAFMGACKVSINNQQTRPFSFKAKVLYPGFPDGLPYANSPEKVQIIKQISSLKRGTKRELVDKEIYFRVGV
mgnify:FL=1